MSRDLFPQYDKYIYRSLIMSNEKANFQERLILYMDILGTKNLIQRQFEEILEVLRVIASNNRKGEIQNKIALDGVT